MASAPLFTVPFVLGEPVARAVPVFDQAMASGLFSCSAPRHLVMEGDRVANGVSPGIRFCRNLLPPEGLEY